jgi:hypothetical protein
MSKKIIILESQYKRVFLNEQQTLFEKNCSYILKNNWVSNEYEIPFYFTLEDPFGDGFDYQYIVWGNCSRSWIRRKKSFRSKGVKNFLEDWEYDWIPNKEEIKKLNAKTKSFYNDYKLKRDKFTDTKNVKKLLDNEVNKLKSKGFITKRYGGENPTYCDLFRTQRMSALLTIRNLVKTYPVYQALTGGQNCLNVKTKDIGVYSYKNAVNYNNKIKNISKERIPKIDVVGDDGIIYKIPSDFKNNAGNTFFLYDFYFDDKGGWGEIIKDVEFCVSGKENPYTKLFPDTVYAFLTAWFGTDNINDIKKSLGSKYDGRLTPFCSGSGGSSSTSGIGGTKDGQLTFMGTLPNADINIHDVLEITAALTFIFPGGQFFALGLELINAGIYLYEGNTTAGMLGILLVGLPVAMPIVRRLGKIGTDKISKLYTKTDDFISKNKNVTKVEINEFMEKEMNSLNLNNVEREAVKELNIQGKTLRNQANKIANMTKKEQKEYLIKNSKELESIWKTKTKYGKGSKYWERQINVTSFERIVILIILLYRAKTSLQSNNKGVDEQGWADLDKYGLGNLTSEDISKIVEDANGLLNVIHNFDYDNFETVKQDSSKQQALNDLSNLLYIVDSVGVNSRFYEDKVKPNINDSKLLYDIHNVITNDKELFDIEYRELSKDVEYKWYKILDCETDPYSKIIIDITNEEKTQTDGYQNDINRLGSLVTLKGDSNYEYTEYNGFWYWKSKNTQSNWRLIKNCLGCSKLQRQLNKELNEITSQFDYENELNYKLDKK